MPAVVAAAQDYLAVGTAAGDAHGEGRRVGAGLDEDDLLRAGDQSRCRSSSRFCTGWTRAKQKPLPICGRDRFVDLLLVVAEDDGAVAAEHVDVVVAVDVDDVAAVAPVEEDRILALHEVVGSADAHDAARGEPLGLGEHGHGFIELETCGNSVPA